MINNEPIGADLEKKLIEIEEKLNKVISIQNTLLEELAVLKSKMRLEHREVRRIEHIIVSLIEELKYLEASNQIDASKISSLVDKYLGNEKTIEHV